MEKYPTDNQFTKNPERRPRYWRIRRFVSTSAKKRGRDPTASSCPTDRASCPGTRHLRLQEPAMQRKTHDIHFDSRRLLEGVATERQHYQQYRRYATARHRLHAYVALAKRRAVSAHYDREHWSPITIDPTHAVSQNDGNRATPP